MLSLLKIMKTVAVIYLRIYKLCSVSLQKKKKTTNLYIKKISVNSVFNCSIYLYSLQINLPKLSRFTPRAQAKYHFPLNLNFSIVFLKYQLYS